jgi:hypothetical protein
MVENHQHHAKRYKEHGGRQSPVVATPYDPASTGYHHHLHPVYNAVIYNNSGGGSSSSSSSSAYGNGLRESPPPLQENSSQIPHDKTGQPNVALLAPPRLHFHSAPAPPHAYADPLPPPSVGNPEIELSSTDTEDSESLKTRLDFRKSQEMSGKFKIGFLSSDLVGTWRFNHLRHRSFKFNATRIVLPDTRKWRLSIAIWEETCIPHRRHSID